MNDKDERSGLNKSGSTIAKGAVVKVEATNDDGIALCTTPATEDVFGVMMADVLDQAWGTVQTRGLALVLAGGTITKGDRLTVAAGGKVITWTAGAGANACVVGTAKRSAVLNDLFEVELAGPAVSRQG
jgi:hypothetical protein